MILELDKTISTMLAIASAGLGIWAHRREMTKERQRLEEKSRNDYSYIQVKEYAAQRDFTQIRKDLDQVHSTIQALTTEADQRLDLLERQVEKILGGQDVLQQMIESQNRERDKRER